MSKYYKAEEVINAIEGKIAEYIPTLYGRYGEIPLELRMAIESLPTIEVSEEVEDERCKGCKHYKLACDLFSEICKYEPITQTETQNSKTYFAFSCEIP